MTTRTPAELLAAELKGYYLLQSRLIDLKSLDHASAEALLLSSEDQNPATTGISESAASASAEVASLRQGIAGLRRQRYTAIGSTYARQAEDQRLRATELRQEADGIVDRSKKHLAALSALEGIQFDHSITLAQRAGASWSSHVPWLPAEYCSPMEAYGDPLLGAGYQIPKSRSLMNAAHELEDAATKLAFQAENRVVQLAGEVDGTDLESLIKNVTGDPMRIGPDLERIGDWVSEVDAAAFTFADDRSKDQPRRYRLVWRDAQIDREDSALYVGSKAYLAAARTAATEMTAI